MLSLHFYQSYDSPYCGMECWHHNLCIHVGAGGWYTRGTISHTSPSHNSRQCAFSHVYSIRSLPSEAETCKGLFNYGYQCDGRIVFSVIMWAQISISLAFWCLDARVPELQKLLYCSWCIMMYYTVGKLNASSDSYRALLSLYLTLHKVCQTILQPDLRMTHTVVPVGDYTHVCVTKMCIHVRTCMSGSSNKYITTTGVP